MHKVIKIDGEKVFIGNTAGEFVEIPLSDFGFEPQVGDMVEFFKNGEQFIVSKLDNQPGAGVGQQKSSRTKLLAAILGLFSGLGIYDFYVGNSRQGLIRLACTLILSFIPVVGFVVGLVNVIWSIYIFVAVITSKPGSKWHQDFEGNELAD